MRNNGDLNSTEKLLNTIRGKTLDDLNEAPPPVPKSSQHRLPLKRVAKKTLTAGVLIDNRHVSLVLTGDAGSGDPRELVKWSHVPFPDQLEMDDARFVSFLRSIIGDFLESHGKVDVWSAIDSKTLKLRNITIPDLPAAKLSNAAFWGLKKEVELDADREIFDFHILGSVQARGVKKKKVLAFSGLGTEVKALKQLFASAGYPVAGITAIPFALQNFMQSGLLSPGEGPDTLVNVTRHQTEITCFHKSHLQLFRTTRTGSHSLVEELTETTSEDVLAILSPELERDSSRFASMEPGAERLVGKVLRTGDYCSNNYAANEPVHQYLFFGETDNCPAFIDYAADQTSTDLKLFNPYEEHPNLTLNTRLPGGAAERSGIIPALGLALSSRDETPNFLYTYVQRNTQAKFRKVNAVIPLLCAAVLLVCLGVWWWQNSVIAVETAGKKTTEAQIAAYVPQVNEALLNQTLKQAQERSRAINRYTADYLPLAVINELCSLTPEKITLVSCDADFKQTLPDTGKKSDKGKKARRSIVLKGVVRGEFTSLESALTGYVIKMGDSPLFGEIILLNKTIESIEDRSVLNFTADMEIL